MLYVSHHSRGVAISFPLLASTGSAMENEKKKTLHSIRFAISIQQLQWYTMVTMRLWLPAVPFRTGGRLREESNKLFITLPRFGFAAEGRDVKSAVIL